VTDKLYEKTGRKGNKIQSIRVNRIGGLEGEEGRGTQFVPHVCKEGDKGLILKCVKAQLKRQGQKGRSLASGDRCSGPEREE